MRTAPLLLLMACQPDPVPCNCKEDPAETGAQESRPAPDSPADTGGETGHTGDTGQPPPDLPVAVYLLAGQSNMDGYSYASALPPSLSVAQTDVRLYWSGNGAWTALQPATYAEAYGEYFGPEVTFGRAMADASPGQTVALIKHAVGGTDLASYWYPGTSRDDPSQGQGYHDFLATLDAALGSIGEDYEIKGMIWMQGESDALSTEDVALAYEDNLARFIARVRDDADAPDMPFIIGKIYCPTCVYGDIVRAAEDAVADADPDVVAFDTDDLPIFTDGIHYDGSGMRTLGERFAAGLLGQDMPPTPQPAFELVGGFSALYTGNFFLGYAFDVSEAVTITDLGTLDYALDGLVTSSQVGLWTADGALLARGTVPAAVSGTTNYWGPWRFVGIDPVALAPGRYVIGSQVYNGSSDLYIHDADVRTATPLTWVESRYNVGTAVAMPVTPYDNPASWFGPNFLYR